MKKLLLATAALAILASPAYGSGFEIYGSYWDVDSADEAIGGGLSFWFPIIGDTVDLQLRATYFEETRNNVLDDFDDLPDDLDELFAENNLEVIPVEAGLRFNFAEGAAFSPYIGGGASYFLLDTNFGEVDDEVGWYANGGFAFGDGNGADFFVEAIYREVEGTLEVDIDDVDDPDDVEILDGAKIDLSGIGANAGVVFRF